MNTETVIVLGNGFDLDLGWDTSYKSFYNKHDGWKVHRTDEDDLFQYVIHKVPGNWFDFERTLHEYALHRSKEPFPSDDAYKIDRDIQDYNTFKDQLARFITEGSKSSVRKESHAYRLLEAYVKAKRNTNASHFFPNRMFSYNYTPLLQVLLDIDSSVKAGYTPVHGMVEKIISYLAFTMILKFQMNIVLFKSRWMKTIHQAISLQNLCRPKQLYFLVCL